MTESERIKSGGTKFSCKGAINLDKVIVYYFKRYANSRIKQSFANFTSFFSKFNQKGETKMQSLAVITNNDAEIDSRQISEWTGKEHQHILRDIRNEIEELGEVGKLIFELGSYWDSPFLDSPHIR